MDPSSVMTDVNNVGKRLDFQLLHTPNGLSLIILPPINAFTFKPKSIKYLFHDRFWVNDKYFTFLVR